MADRAASPSSPGRSTRFRIVAAILSGAAALGIFVGIELFLHRTSIEEASLLAAARPAARAAGCSEIRTVAPYPGELDRSHIGGTEAPSAPPLSGYPSVPPASGPHGSSTLGQGAYRNPPDVRASIHSLEHAAVVVWFDPADVDDPEVRRIRSFFGRGDQISHVIVAPYSYPDEGEAGELPEGTAMALVAWHRVRTCAQPSLPVAYDFVHRYRFDVYRWGSYEGDAPERLSPI